MLLDQVHKLLMLDCSRAYNDHVFTKIIASVEVSDHFAVNLPDVVDVSENRLAHHVISVAIKVHVFHQGFFRVLISCFELLPDSVFLEL